MSEMETVVRENVQHRFFGTHSFILSCMYVYIHMYSVHVVVSFQEFMHIIIMRVSTRISEKRVREREREIQLQQQYH